MLDEGQILTLLGREGWSLGRGCIIATTMLNADYPSHVAYLDAIAREMAYEYRSMVDTGFVLQIDAPDLAMRTDMSGRSSAHWRRRPSGRCCSIRSGPTCREPWVKGLTIMTNSIYNDWRMEDVWLKRLPAAAATGSGITFGEE
jgi:hypothetical protein